MKKLRMGAEVSLGGRNSGVHRQVIAAHRIVTAFPIRASSPRDLASKADCSGLRLDHRLLGNNLRVIYVPGYLRMVSTACRLCSRIKLQPSILGWAVRKPSRTRAAFPSWRAGGLGIRADGTGGGPRPCVVLCRCLCRNPAIPAGVWPLLAVSFRYTRKAVNVRETRMNTAFLCRFVSLSYLPYQCTPRFDTEEVAGSNPVVPTIFINGLQ